MERADMYRVETIEKTAAPAGIASGTWCRYVIVNGRSRVVGRYRGTLSETRLNAEQLVSSVNERRQSNRSAWTPRSTLVRRKATRGKPRTSH